MGFKKKPKLKPYQQAVTSFPEVNKIKLSDDIEFIIMGCDGIWDCVDIQQLCEYISNELNSNTVISNIISNIFDKILAGSLYCKLNLIITAPIGTDNMSCIIIDFKAHKENNL